MNHAQLRAFHAVALAGGFSRAAERLGLTQPAISDHIRKLEEAYGVQLFTRGARKVELTDTGRRLFAITERQFEAEGEADELLSRTRSLQEGALAIGADAAIHVLPLLARFRERHPGVRLKVTSGNSAQLLARLESYDIDLAVVAERPAASHFASRVLSDSRLVLFVPQQHPLAGRRKVSFASLAGTPLVLRELGSVTRRLVDEEFSSRGLSPATAIEIEGREAAAAAVAAGLGAGIVSAGEFRAGEGLRAIPFSDWQVTMTEYLVWRSDRAGLAVMKAALAA